MYFDCVFFLVSISETVSLDSNPKMKYLILVFLVVNLYTNVEPLDLKDLGKAAVDVTKGVIDKIPDVIPKPEDIFQGGKNLIAGYPFEQIFSAINSFCEFIWLNSFDRK